MYMIYPAQLTFIGADTTRTSVSAVFFYLTASPECYKKLVAEIRNTFHSSDDIQTGTKLAQCQYLRACVDETLRISPPLAATLWREVCAGGMDIDNQHVPAGTDVGISTYAMGYNERIHSSPSLFVLERWIISEANPQESVQKARHGFQSFSIGPRSCIGRTMAYMELLNTVAKTCWHLDFKRAEGLLGQVSVGIHGGEGRENINEFQLADHITSSHKRPYLQFRLRDRS